MFCFAFFFFVCSFRIIGKIGTNNVLTSNSSHIILYVCVHVLEVKISDRTRRSRLLLSYLEESEYLLQDKYGDHLKPSHILD